MLKETNPHEDTPESLAFDEKVIAHSILRFRNVYLFKLLLFIADFIHLYLKIGSTDTGGDISRH